MNAGTFEELRAALEVVRAAVDHIFGAAAAQLQVPLDAICAAIAQWYAQHAHRLLLYSPGHRGGVQQPRTSIYYYYYYLFLHAAGVVGRAVEYLFNTPVGATLLQTLSTWYENLPVLNQFRLRLTAGQAPGVSAATVRRSTDAVVAGRPPS